MPGCFCTRAQRGDRRTQTKPGMDKRKRVILKTCRASVIFPFFLWLMEEGLPLSEGWANSNEAVCGTESCLAMAHSSEILQLPGCQKPSIVPGSPAGLRAMDHGAKTSSFSQMRSALTSSSPVSFPSSHQTFPLIKSCYFSGYRVMKHRVASSFFLTVHIHQGVISFSFTWGTVQQSRYFAIYVACIQTKGYRKFRKLCSELSNSHHHFCQLVKRSFLYLHIHRALPD